MANSVLIRYVGCKVLPTLREYTFQVKSGADEACEYKLTIANDAFNSRRARFQDAPDICAHRVQRELDASSNHPQKMRLAISDADLEEYRSAHSPKPRIGGSFKPPSKP